MAEVLSELLLMPKRSHPPLPGAGLPASDRFLQSQLEWLARTLDKRAPVVEARHFAVGSDTSLPLRGESVPRGSRWSGNPIGPWRAVTVRAYQKAAS